MKPFPVSGLLMGLLLMLGLLSVNPLGAEDPIRPGSGFFPEIDLIEADSERGQVRTEDLPEEKLLKPSKRRFGLLLFLGLSIPFLLFRAFIGSRRGFLRELSGLLPVILFLVLIFQTNTTYAIIRWIDAEQTGWPGWVLHFLAGAFILGCLYSVSTLVAVIGTRLFGRRADGSLRLSWRLGGGLLGAAVGSAVILLILTALYTFSTFAWYFHREEEQPMFLTRFFLTSRQTIDQSFLAQPVQFLEPLREEDYALLSSIRLAIFEGALEKTLEEDDPGPWLSFLETPSVARVFEDPELRRRIEAGEYVALLFHPHVREALRDPEVREALRQRLESSSAEQEKETEGEESNDPNP